MAAVGSKHFFFCKKRSKKTLINCGRLSGQSLAAPTPAVDKSFLRRTRGGAFFQKSAIFL
jgi:hypothetical protein